MTTRELIAWAQAQFDYAVSPGHLDLSMACGMSAVLRELYKVQEREMDEAVAGMGHASS